MRQHFWFGFCRHVVRLVAEGVSIGRQLAIEQQQAPALQECRSRQCIIIEAVGEQFVHAAIGQAVAEIDDAPHRHADAHIPAGAQRRVAGEIGGIDEEIHRGGDAVAQGGRAKQRQHQIRPRFHPPARQRLPEILWLGRAAEIGGDIHDAGHAQRGIEQEAIEDAKGLRQLALQHGVGEIGRFGIIAIGIGDRGAGKARHHGAIHAGGRAQHKAIQALVEGMDAAIAAFPRIGLCPAEIGAAGGGTTRQPDSKQEAKNPQHHHHVAQIAPPQQCA